jgi:hypothetical protein
MQTNELYQLAVVAFCLLLAWVKLPGLILETCSVIYSNMSTEYQCNVINGISLCNETIL